MKRTALLLLICFWFLGFCKQKPAPNPVVTVDPMVEKIRAEAAPQLRRLPEDVGVRTLEGGFYAVTTFALVNQDMSATVYDLWQLTADGPRKMAHLGPGRTLVQLKLNEDIVFDYLLEGGMPGTGRETVTAFLGRMDGGVDKVGEVSAPSDEAPQIAARGMCEKTVIETLAAAPKRYAFDCAARRFVELK